MALLQDTAIVLRRLDYSETSQVLAVLTREHGQQRLIAKGVKRSTKKKVAVGIDLLELGRLIFSRRPGGEESLGQLTEWVQLDHFRSLRSSLASMYAAQYAAEVTLQLTEAHDPHPGLFDALRQLFEQLSPTQSEAPLVHYLWELLTHIGLRPELGRCLNCARDVAGDQRLFFSSRQGGTICRDCESAIVEKRAINPKLASSLAADESIPPPLVHEAFDLLDYHLTNVMSRRPKMSDMVKQAFRQR